MKKWLIKIKQEFFKYLCRKNIHFYKTLFSGYPAFSDSWYKTSMCPCCKKTKLTLQNNPTPKPPEMEYNRNYINYNKNLTEKELELSREMVYKMNRKLKKISEPHKDTVK